MGIMIVFKNNLKRSLNNKKSFIVTLIIPIVIILLSVVANYANKTVYNIGIIDREENRLSKHVISLLEATEGINTGVVVGDRLKTDMITGKFNAVVTFEHDEIQIDAIREQHTSNNIYTLLQLYKVAESPISYLELKEYIPAYSLSVAGGILSLLLLTLMITATMHATIIIKDKRARTYLRYKYAPKSSISYVFGNILYNIFITLLQVSIVTVLVLSLGINLRIPIQDFLVIELLIVLIATSFGTLITSLFNDDMYANISASCIALLFSLFGGAFILYEKMPALLKSASVTSPIRWIIKITESLENGQGIMDNTFHISVLFGFTIAILIFAIVLNYRKRKEIKL